MNLPPLVIFCDFRMNLPLVEIGPVENITYPRGGAERGRGGGYTTLAFLAAQNRQTEGGKTVTNETKTSVKDVVARVSLASCWLVLGAVVALWHVRPYQAK